MTQLIVTGRYAIGEGVWHVTTAPGVSTEAMPADWVAVVAELDEAEDDDRWQQCQEVDEAQSEYTDWRM